MKGGQIRPRLGDPPRRIPQGAGPPKRTEQIDSPGRTRTERSAENSQRITSDTSPLLHDGHLDSLALGANRAKDVWMPNAEEINRQAEPGQDGGPTDPWDPDSDNDGLTDGQEDHWVTGLESALTHDPTPYLDIVKRDVNDQGLFDFDPALGTDPNDAITDLEGWVGGTAFDLSGDRAIASANPVVVKLVEKVVLWLAGIAAG